MLTGVFGLHAPFQTCDSNCGSHVLQLTEEAGITALDLTERGILTFVFDDGKHWEVHGVCSHWVEHAAC